MSKVSIIIPTYNCSKYIEAAIDSVLNQTYKDFEMIVVDDGSTDNTREVLSAYKNAIHYFYQENKGVSAARNAGFKVSKGQYVAFLDADDIWMPEKIEKDMEVFERNQNISLVYCWWRNIDENGYDLPQVCRVKINRAPLKRLLRKSLLPTSVCLMKRESVEQAGLFDENLKGAEDWDLFLRMAMNGHSFSYVPLVLSKYRIRKESVCSDIEIIEKRDLLFLDKVYKNSEKLENFLSKSQIDELKSSAYFYTYATYCWKYYRDNNFEEGRKRLFEALKVYPKAFGLVNTYFLFANSIIPRGFRSKEEVNKNTLLIEEVLNSAFDDLFIHFQSDGLTPYLKQKIYSNLFLCLAFIFYYARETKKARLYFLKAFKITPFLILKPVNFYTFLKSFLSKNIFIKRANFKRRSSKKTILYFLDIFPALSETFILNEILELEKKGFNIVIFARKKEDSVRHELLNNLKARVFYLTDAHKIGVEKLFLSHIKIFFLKPVSYIRTFVFSIKNRKKAMFWFFKIACYHADIVRKYEFSHIHSHFASMASCYAMFISKLLGKPYTFTIHGPHNIFEAPCIDLKERIGQSKLVVTISEYNKNYLIKHFGINKDKIKVVYSGINLGRFSFDKNKTENGNTILFVGRIEPMKGLTNLIKACEILDSKSYNFKCFIIGGGREENSIANLINKLKLNSKISMEGPKSTEEVKEYLEKADIFVLPTIKDSMGVVSMEAMACGLPVISSNIHGIPELIEHGKTGFLCEPNDYQKIAEYLEILIKNPGVRKEMGNLGRQKIKKDFNLEKEVGKLISVFNEDGVN